MDVDDMRLSESMRGRIGTLKYIQTHDTGRHRGPNHQSSNRHPRKGRLLEQNCFSVFLRDELGHFLCSFFLSV